MNGIFLIIPGIAVLILLIHVTAETVILFGSASSESMSLTAEKVWVFILPFVWAAWYVMALDNTIELIQGSSQSRTWTMILILINVSLAVINWRKWKNSDNAYWKNLRHKVRSKIDNSGVPLEDAPDNYPNLTMPKEN